LNLAGARRPSAKTVRKMMARSARQRVDLVVTILLRTAGKIPRKLSYLFQKAAEWKETYRLKRQAH
jgi:hypothetical protein